MATAITDYTKLPLAERIALVGDIWDSIAAEGRTLGLTDEQRAENDRHRQQAADGTAEWVLWEDVKRNSYERD